jgi:hypothetical protein
MPTLFASEYICTLCSRVVLLVGDYRDRGNCVRKFRCSGCSALMSKVHILASVTRSLSCASKTPPPNPAAPRIRLFYADAL